ncbi:hypothetical protein TREMEDRAFT_57113 [Tremella mesenterica DSM 1558]|nr:uncharacterized protein TREMEDRAFT_57113 [Tremella mesenterica DSM 1558]EIW69173.1 hypothetical protein TREMEDRAFT_57113 [Tremella mesenterica DSM 1558]
MTPGGYLAMYYCLRRTYSPNDTTSSTSTSTRHPSQKHTDKAASLDSIISPRPTSPSSVSTTSGDGTALVGPPLQEPPIVNGHPQKILWDIWQAMHSAMASALQPAVVLGEIGPKVAPRILDVPFWPRTLAESQKSLSGLDDWEILREEVIDHNDGISMEERRDWMQAGLRIHRLTHPAWTALCAGEIDRPTYARRIAAWVSSVYETHMKQVLRTHGDRDVGHAEMTVSDTFRILVDKCEAGVLDALQLDIGIVLLRRK